MSLNTSNFLLFKRPNGGQLKISAQALQQMRVFRQLNPADREAGGILLGRLLLDCPDVVVDEITVPMPSDKRSRFAFYRHKRGHQAIIDRRWQESGGTCVYLGEWHTHPQSTPTPSLVDLTDWKRKLRTDSFGENLYFLIIGMMEARMWFGDRHLKQVQPMENILTVMNEDEHNYE